ncbi:hypothetical protein [Gordonia sp. (in: high G+C Gram-positive bacteria)]|uniref:hypothetical protein n=1 Tax=Gordonia sp. (in: high G+C Gram-positive bacteria) TaxID=84139 RepID=UPI0039E49A64
MLVVDSAWSLREEFLREVRSALQRFPARTPWYPGSRARLDDAAASHESVETFGDGRLLVTVEGDGPDAIERTEYFAPVLGVVELDGGGDAQTFLDAAVDYANDRLTGTLGANVLVDPGTKKRLGGSFGEAIARLRYGGIGVNAWTGLAFLTPTATWGAFPGHTLDDAQSGIGIVHNALLIPHAERTVVTGPFRPFPRSVLGGEFALFPKPPWFVSARSAASTGRRLSDFATAPSWLKLPGIFAAAFRA